MGFHLDHRLLWSGKVGIFNCLVLIHLVHPYFKFKFEKPLRLFQLLQNFIQLLEISQLFSSTSYGISPNMLLIIHCKRISTQFPQELIEYDKFEQFRAVFFSCLVVRMRTCPAHGESLSHRFFAALAHTYPHRRCRNGWHAAHSNYCIANQHRWCDACDGASRSTAVKYLTCVCVCCGASLVYRKLESNQREYNNEQ